MFDARQNPTSLVSRVENLLQQHPLKRPASVAAPGSSQQQQPPPPLPEKRIARIVFVGSVAPAFLSLLLVHLGQLSLYYASLLLFTLYVLIGALLHFRYDQFQRVLRALERYGV